jgi:hypothetical protein
VTKRTISLAGLFCITLCTVVLCVQPAFAYFERIVLSSRSLSLGGAFAAIADDPSATVINPAGLTQITSYSFSTTLVRPYDLSDLEEHFVAAAIPTRIGAFGLSWHRLALSDVISEDVFTIAYGRDYIRTSQDASLSFGAGVDIGRVAFSDRFDESKTVVTGSAGVLLRPFPVIAFGYTLRNIGEPSFDLVEGGGDTRLEMTHRFGVAYYFERRIAAIYERQRGQDSRWRNLVGVEMSPSEGFQLRAGLKDGDVTGGIGIEVSRIKVDVGVASHDVLGVSYIFSLGFALPSKDAEGPGRW